MEAYILPLVQGQSSILGALAGSNFSKIQHFSRSPLVADPKTTRGKDPVKSLTVPIQEKDQL